MKKLSVRKLAAAAMIGAAYAVMAIFGSVFGLTFGTIQFRFSEALCVLPFLFPEAVGGLFVGCLIANLFSPYGLLDIVVGSLATLLAAWLTSRCRSRYLAPLPPVLFNGVIVGAVVTIMNEAGHLVPSAFTLPVFAATALTVALGELAVCAVGGYPLMLLLERNGLAQRWQWDR